MELQERILEEKVDMDKAKKPGTLENKSVQY